MFYQTLKKSMLRHTAQTCDAVVLPLPLDWPRRNAVQFRAHMGHPKLETFPHFAEDPPKIDVNSSFLPPMTQDKPHSGLNSIRQL